MNEGLTQHPQKINAWGRKMNNPIIGPDFFGENITVKQLMQCS